MKRTRRTILMAFAAVAAMSPTFTGVANAVAGGTPQATPSSVVFIALPSGSVCSGSLIDKYWVLTAHHCASDNKAGQYVDRGDGTPKAKVDLVIPAPSGADLALMQLEAPLDAGTFDGQTEYMPLAAASDPDPQVGGHITVYGYGSGGLVGATSVVTNYDKAGSIDVKGDNGSAREGDSGGPIVAKVNGHEKLYGVISGGGGHGSTYADLWTGGPALFNQDHTNHAATDRQWITAWTGI